MKMAKDIRPISYLKANAASLLEQINQNRRPIIITQNGEPKGVLQDPESYEAMRRAIGILKLVVQGEDNIGSGKVFSHASAKKRLQKKLSRITYHAESKKV